MKVKAEAVFHLQISGECWSRYKYRSIKYERNKITQIYVILLWNLEFIQIIGIC